MASDTPLLRRALGVVRCPECEALLEPTDDGVVCANGHRFGLVAGQVPDLAADVAEPTTLSQRAMRFQPLVDVYESTWRPLFTTAAGGTDPDAETTELIEWLGVGPDATLLDIACGPGNTSRRLAVGVPDGVVIGLDLSIPMLTQAVNRTPAAANIGFARVDVHHLPVADRSVDGVHCAAALYMLEHPETAVAEFRRVLRPGGRFVGMTIVSPIPVFGPIGRLTQKITRAVSGLHYADADELSAWCDAAGLTDFRFERRGAALLFAADVPG